MNNNMNNIIIITKNDNSVLRKGQIIKNWLKENYPEKNIILESEYNNDNSNIDLIICIGGDGTLLYSNKFLCLKKDIFIFLIGSGTLEFIPNNKYENYKDDLKLLFNGKYTVNNLTKIDIPSVEYQAINEFSIHRNNSAKILTLEIYINDFLISTFRGDGLIISTPIGSTAYNLSAGGSLVSPNNNVLIITPICPFSLSFRPLIISDDSNIKIKIINSDSNVQISGDGNLIKNIEKGENIIIKKSSNKIRMLYVMNNNLNNWYFNLKNKLNWGI